jgi:2-oxoglutarate dehydrogenase E1 component
MVDFTSGGFKEVIDDPYIKDTAKVKRVLLCSGKMYFDLSEKQLIEKREDVAIVRLEQIYPVPVEQLYVLKEKYKQADWVWVQEEPRNMGALTFLAMYPGLSGLTTDGKAAFPMRYISRPAGASTATGFAKKHALEQAKLVEEAFAF